MSRLPQTTMEELLAEWYPYIKSLPCYVSGERGRSEAAHIKLIPSGKTGELLPRSHKTIAAFSCIPLTPELHRLGRDSIHAIGEQRFFEHHGVPHPAGWLFGRLAFFLVRQGEMWLHKIEMLEAARDA